MIKDNEIIHINDIYTYWRYKKLIIFCTRNIVIELKDL